MSEPAVSTGLRARIDAAPMSRAQIVAVTVLGVLSALDGYDVLAVTFAAPGLTEEFGVDRAALGFLLAVGLLGMGLGSLLLAPFADRFGRKPVVIVSLVCMALGMAGAAWSRDIETLTIWRLITGLGIGAMVAVIAPLAVEFSNARWRTASVAVMALGYPIGGVVGGGVAALMLLHYDWRAVFYLGAAMALLMLPLALICLPESLSFLVTRRGERARLHLLRVLKRLGFEGDPAASAATNQTAARAAITWPMLARLAHVTLINFFYVVAVYYILSWMPQMVADQGFEPAIATLMSVVASGCGVVGGTLMGLLGARLPLKPLVIVAFLGLGVSIILFGMAPANIVWIAAAAGLVGFFLYSGAVGAYAVVTQSFPPRVRTSAVGFVVGIGRGGSALAPVIAGVLFAQGVSSLGVSVLLGATAIFAALLLLTFRVRTDESD